MIIFILVSERKEAFRILDIEIKNMEHTLPIKSKQSFANILTIYGCSLEGKIVLNREYLLIKPL